MSAPLLLRRILLGVTAGLDGNVTTRVGPTLAPALTSLGPAGRRHSYQMLATAQWLLAAVADISPHGHARACLAGQGCGPQQAAPPPSLLVERARKADANPVPALPDSRFSTQKAVLPLAPGPHPHPTPARLTPVPLPSPPPLLPSSPHLLLSPPLPFHHLAHHPTAPTPPTYTPTLPRHPQVPR